MPSRLLKESIWTSPNLNMLSPLAERHFFRVLPCSDDWGCFEATPLVVKGRCYPLQPATRVTDIEKWHDELAAQGILRLWTVGDRIYAQFTTFGQHNAVLQQHKPTTPCPPWMLNESGFDSRLATETLQAFERIGVAIENLSSKNEKATYRKICENAGCSMSTLKKYYNHKEKAGCYGMLQPATDATHKNPNPNPNPNPIKNFLSDSDEIRLAEFFFQWVQKNNPKARAPNFQAWAKGFDKILRIDKRSVADVRELIEWCQKDDFECANVLSPDKLRKRFDQLWLKKNRASRPTTGNRQLDQNIQACANFMNRRMQNE